MSFQWCPCGKKTRRIPGTTQQLSLRSDQRQYSLYSTHPSDPSCDWLCLVNNAEQALELPTTKSRLIAFVNSARYPLTVLGLASEMMKLPSTPEVCLLVCFGFLHLCHCSHCHCIRLFVLLCLGYHLFFFRRFRLFKATKYKLLVGVFS